MFYIRVPLLTNLWDQPVKTKTAYMKSFFALFALFFTTVTFSQQRQCTMITYKMYMAIPFASSYSGGYDRLIANESAGIFYHLGGENYSDAQSAKNYTAPIPGDVLPIIETMYTRADAEKKELLLFSHLARSTALVKDTYGGFNWNVGSETKVIEGYTCYKAEAYYRGRTWTAWFTPQIPVPFGPWKLLGLPGLILQAYDATGEVSFDAVQVSTAGCDLLQRDFKSLIKTKNKVPMPYRECIEKNKEFFDNLDKQVDADSKAIVVPDFKVPRFGYELRYEWEE